MSDSTLMSGRLVLMGASVVFLIGTLDARAQGIGRSGSPPGHEKRAVTGTTRAPSLPPTNRRAHTFGSWLDTADVSARGEVWTWVSTAYWRSQAFRQIDAPAVGLSVGIGRGAQVGLSVPYYFLADHSGPSSRGFGASYVTTKFALTPGRHVDISASPTLEILNSSSEESGIRRVHFLLPVSAQTYAGAFRVYGTTGYASRGSVFGGAAVERSVRGRLTFSTSFSHAYSVVSDPASDELGIPRHRTDASAGAYFSLGPRVVLFASAGRTVRPVDETSGRLALSAGMTWNIARRGTNVPRAQ